MLLGASTAQPFEQRRPALLLLTLPPLVAAPARAARHFAPVWRPFAGSHLDGGALHGHGPDGHLVATLEDERHHLNVQQALHVLIVDVSDQVPCSQARFVGRRVLFHSLQSKTRHRDVSHIQ